MEGYLGEEIVKQEDSPFKDYTKADWSLYFIQRYGGFERPQHKAWVLDQVARILNDMPVVIKLAKWSNGETEYRVIVSEEESEQYIKYVEECKDGKDGPNTYEYNIGSTP